MQYLREWRCSLMTVDQTAGPQSDAATRDMNPPTSALARSHLDSEVAGIILPGGNST